MRIITYTWIATALLVLVAGIAGFLNATWVLVGLFGLWAGLTKLVAVRIWRPLMAAAHASTAEVAEHDVRRDDDERPRS